MGAVYAKGTSRLGNLVEPEVLGGNGVRIKLFFILGGSPHTVTHLFLIQLCKLNSQDLEFGI